jgi:hypothetical protein
MTSYPTGAFYEASGWRKNRVGKEIKEKHGENKGGIIKKEDEAKHGLFDRVICRLLTFLLGYF